MNKDMTYFILVNMWRIISHDTNEMFVLETV